MSEPAKPHLRIVSAIEQAETLAAGPEAAEEEAAQAASSPGPSEQARAEDASRTEEPRFDWFPDDGDDETDMFCALLPTTDLGNAQRFVRRFGKQFLYVMEWGWMAWDGRRWEGHNAEAMVQRAVHETVKLIAAEARKIRLYHQMVSAWQDADPRSRNEEIAWPGWPSVNPIVKQTRTDAVRLSDRLNAWCISSQGNAHLTCMARLAQHYLTASTDAFDADPMAFNVANGTLRFQRREDGEDYVSFHPHAREDLFTKMSPVTYDPAAQCPLYDRFLERVHPDADDQGQPMGGSAMRRHLAILGGISLTALQIPRMWFWYGVGRNGKSVLADVWAHVAGEYSQSIPIESFLDQGKARRGGEASPDIASLVQVRLLRTSEPEKRSKLAEALIKRLTGGEKERARHLNRDFFEFLPVFKLIMQGNYKPTIEGTDEGIWARMVLVFWRITIPEHERDPNLTAKLKAEASGILNRLLDGIRDYLDHGLMLPDEVISATQEYRDDSDPIGRFIKECTAASPKSRSPGGELYRLYEAWAAADGTPKWSPKAFKRGMADHGIRAMKSSGVFYLDIITTKSRHDFDGQKWGADDDDDQH